MTIPALRKAGFFVERITRPKSRGVKYRVYKLPDETAAIVYGRHQLERAAHALLNNLPLPLHPMIEPAGRNAPRQKAYYL